MMAHDYLRTVLENVAKCPHCEACREAAIAALEAEDEPEPDSKPQDEKSPNTQA